MPPFVATLLGSKWTWVAVAAVVSVTAALIYIGHVRSEGVKEGAAQVTTQVQSNTIKVQRKINNAEAAAPRTPSDVSRSLRQHEF